MATSLKVLAERVVDHSQFNAPSGITYSVHNKKVYVADTENHRIQILTPDLRFISVLGKEGGGKGQFSWPCGVVTDNTGKLYVADSKNSRVQVFTAQGRFFGMFGKKGAGRGELDWPWGVGVDGRRGLVYVSEFSNHRVSVFTSEGKFVTSFGGKGWGPGQTESPHGLAVDDCGVVYVCSHDVHLF